jgi:type I restriction enzyme S subunit
MLSRHLSTLGFEFRQGRVKKGGQSGPDFGLTLGDRTIWIEAIVPSPEGIPSEWLESPKIGESRSRSMPADQMLLRWTAAIKEKTEKFKKYFEKEIIGDHDCCVVAVNSCRLANFVVDDHGISQMPFAVEAVFPVGPIGVRLYKDGRPADPPTRIPRFSIRNANLAEVPTDSFLNPNNSIVSAVIGSYRREMLDGNPRMTVVHNPLARSPLPKGILGASKEYVAEADGEGYMLRLLTK